MTNALSELTPANAIDLLNSDLVPELTGLVRDMFSVPDVDKPVIPYLESELIYGINGDVSGVNGSIDARLAIAYLQPARAGMNNDEPIPSRRFYMVRLENEETGIVGVGLSNRYELYGSPQPINNIDLQQLLGRTYIALALAHSIDPALLKIRPKTT